MIVYEFINYRFDSSAPVSDYLVFRKNKCLMTLTLEDNMQKCRFMFFIYFLCRPRNN